MACRAAENHIWISANNSTTRPSRWGSFLVRPDGAIINKLPLHRAAVMVNDVFFDASFYDAPGPWRDRAIAGQLHSGCTVKDKRSRDRTVLFKARQSVLFSRECFLLQLNQDAYSTFSLS